MPEAIPARLTEVHLPPRLILHPSDVSSASNEARQWAESGLTTRTIRGRKMATEQGVFDEFGAALQFPHYFGENWPAFDECLTDLEWLPSNAGYVLVATDADEVLIAEEDGSLRVLSRLLMKAIEEWATLVALGEWWDRPAVAFSVVLQVAPARADACRDRWQGAGAVIEPLR